ncbi:MAG TPA: non-heme iron oxygenase ferredoxin subunit [Acidimicrobiales bacterium]|nr:non-heme iron oxygenase ferredoxin subunit [Acidimicrobiales bacterium]
MSDEAGGRHRLCGVDEVAPGRMAQVQVDGVGCLAVYNIDGRFYATDDGCTHSAGSLSEGDLEDDVVVCPVHFGMFHVPTGKALGYPAEVDVRTYVVETDDRDVFVVTGGPS